MEGLGGVEGELKTMVGIWPDASMLRHSRSHNLTVFAHKVRPVEASAVWLQHQEQQRAGHA